MGYSTIQLALILYKNNIQPDTNPLNIDDYTALILYKNNIQPNIYLEIAKNVMR